MRKYWMLTAPLLIASCAIVRTASFGSTLILKPQIQAGHYSTKTVVNAYTQASINHLILKLYTYDGTEHDQGIQKSIPNAQLGNSITFTNLRANTTYRIKAYAYLTADESHPISTTDANSYTDITLTTEDHPTIAALKVKLIDIAFNGQGTGSLAISAGGYSYAATESLLVPTVVTTLAGGGGATLSGYVDATGTSAKFGDPFGIAVDGSGNIYIADTSNTRIRKISNGVVSTYAGQLTQGYVNGTGTAAQFYNPKGVAVDATGTVYVADYSNSVIRKITSNAVVSLLAGAAQAPGYTNGQGAGAQFNGPTGVAVDSAGNVYVADNANNAIRKVTSGGLVSTFAGSQTGGMTDGTGTAAKFSHPTAVAIDGNGTVYVADQYNHRIRKITSDGVVSTLAGQTTAGYQDGTGTAAKFNYPLGVAVDYLGNVYVTEQSNNLIRKITSDGVVSTLAGGCGATAYGYLDGLGTATLFNRPNGITVDWAGNVYVADEYNKLIRYLH